MTQPFPRFFAGPLGLALALSVAPAWAQEPSAAALLLVENGGEALSEDFGAAVYGCLLEAGPYAEVEVLTAHEGGEERLGPALAELGARHAAVDVFLSTHTTERRAEELLAALPSPARHIRLVYSTACEGAQAERAAWIAVGARTVVTHQGTNDPLVAFPYFLSRWIRGEPLLPIVRDGYLETSRVHLVLASLAGSELSFGGDLLGESLQGSRPVVQGDPEVTVRTGLVPRPLRPPAGLRYARGSGGSLGLALRAANGFSASGAEVRGALGLFGGLLPGPLRAILADLVRVSVGPGAGHTGGSGASRTLPPRVSVTTPWLRIERSRKVTVPLDGIPGAVLVVGTEVRLRPGSLDPESGRFSLQVAGVWARRGALAVRIRRVGLRRSRAGEYRLAVAGGALGFVPLGFSVPVGRAQPAAFSAPEPLLLDREGLAARLADPIR